MNLRCSVFIFSLLLGTSSFPTSFHPDRVISLPGAPLEPEFNLFSGFLNGSSNATSIPMFYVLAEAIRVDPSTAPLVVWFNGGPGGSSLSAFFKEHGPYRLAEKEDVLTYNEFSWNQYANILYLESPLGVGFSQNSEGDLTTNDVDAAEINYNALKDLMTRVHPSYADQEFFLSGQSYAGAFVPYFARRILKGIESGEMKNDKLKGFAIGNPVINTDGSLYVAEAMQFLSYGVMPLRFTEDVLQSWVKYEQGEKLAVEDIVNATSFVYGEIIGKYIGINSPMNYNFAEHCYDLDQSEAYHAPTDKQSIACYGGAALRSYMNRMDVQTALHVGNFSVGTKNWTAINVKIAHELFVRDRNLLPVYKDIFTSVRGSSFRVLIYNGDTDVMISPLQTVKSVDKIAEANSLEGEEYISAWRFYGDFAGMHKSYSHRNVTMDVITVRGAGHSVPTDLPAQAFQMINNFLFTGEKGEINYSEPIRKHGKL